MENRPPVGQSKNVTVLTCHPKSQNSDQRENNVNCIPYFPSKAPLTANVPSRFFMDQGSSSAPIHKPSGFKIIRTPEYRMSSEDLATLKSQACFKTCQTHPSAPFIRDFLCRQKIIKVVVGGGSGFGHKQAAITGMMRLRELGFTGQFLIETDCAETQLRVMAQLGFLLAGYDLGEYRLQIHNTREHCSLGFAFGSEHSSYAKYVDFSVDHCITLQPTDWPVWSVEGIQSKAFKCKTDKDPHFFYDGILAAKSGTLYNQNSPKPISKAVELILDLKNTCKILTVYGLRSWPLHSLNHASSVEPVVVGLTPTQEMSVVLQGLLKRGETVDPVIVCVIADEIDIYDLKPLGVFQRVMYFSQDELDDLTQKQLAPGAVCVVHFAKLPSPDFHALVTQADAVIAEGSNTLSLAQQEGLPFIVGGRYYSTRVTFNNPFYLQASKALCMAQSSSIRSTTQSSGFFSSFDDDDEQENSRIAFVDKKECDALTLDLRAQAVGDFMDKCFAGDLRADYQACQESFLNRPCKVVAALRLLMECVSLGE